MYHRYLLAFCKERVKMDFLNLVPKMFVKLNQKKVQSDVNLFLFKVVHMYMYFKNKYMYMYYYITGNYLSLKINF